MARQLLGHNADVLACNSQGSWSLDMAAANTPVWDALYEEISWRSSLEQPRLCQLVLVSRLCMCWVCHLAIDEECQSLRGML